MRLSSLTPGRPCEAAPILPDADSPAPSQQPEVDNSEPSQPLRRDDDLRRQSPLPPSTPLSQSLSQSPACPPTAPQSDDEAIPAPCSRPQRRRNLPHYLDDYVLSPFQQSYNVECAKLLDPQHFELYDCQFRNSCSLPSINTKESSQLLYGVSSRQTNSNSDADITVGFVYPSSNNLSSATVPSHSFCITTSF